MAPVHEYVVNGTITAAADCALDKTIEESSECRGGHFAGRHCKFAVADPTAAHRVTLGSDVVGWVSDHHFSALGA